MQPYFWLLTNDSGLCSTNTSCNDAGILDFVGSESGFTGGSSHDYLLTFDTPTTSAGAAVPFEFSPTLGFLAVGGIFGIYRLRKNIAAKKTIANLSA